MKKLLIIAMTLSLAACDIIQRDSDKATDVAVQWGEAFFNCDYHAAEALCTPDSRRWLQFAASNTTQHDLDLLKQHAPEASDTLRVVELAVRNSLSPNINAEESSQIEEALFHTTVVKRNGQWLVRMEGLPRSEKQSRD